jgi:hypothetical protein
LTHQVRQSSSIAGSLEERLRRTVGCGEKVTLAPVGVRDDPVSLELMQVLKDGVTSASATT